MLKFTNLRHPRPSSANKGFALISVLWLVALLGALAICILSLARNDLAIAYTARDGLQAEGWADAGIFLTIHKLANAQLAKTVPIDGQEQKLAIDNHAVTVAVQDELGKMDINFAPRDMLQSLLATSALDADRSAAIAVAIEEKRNAGFKSEANAQLAGAAPAAILYAPPFRTVEEVKSIPGVTDDLFRRIRPALTVYAQQPAVQTATAPAIVLRALPGIDDQKIRDILVARHAHPITAGDIGMMESTSYQGIMAGRVFTITSSAHVGSSTFTRRAVVLLIADAKRPYRILEWGMELQ